MREIIKACHFPQGTGGLGSLNSKNLPPRGSGGCGREKEVCTEEFWGSENTVYDLIVMDYVITYLSKPRELQRQE